MDGNSKFMLKDLCTLKREIGRCLEIDLDTKSYRNFSE